MENQKSIEEVKNYGVDLEKEKLDRTETDWIFGATTPKCMAEEISGLVTASYAWPNPVNGVYPRVSAAMNHCWIFFQELLKKYFPTGQIQNLGEEKSNCVTNGFNNELEKKLNYAYQTGKFHQPFIDFLNKYKFFDSEGKIRLSNRIPAVGSGTTRTGNSLKAVINWITNNGIFPQSILPEDYAMSFNQYYDRTKITPEMIVVGKESLKYLTINYAIVNDMGKYPDYSGGFKWKIFDNYLDPVDGDFVKRLAEDYIIMDYGYKLIINENTDTPNVNVSVKKNMYILKRDPQSPNEVYAFNEDMNVKRHIANKGTLKEGARSFDQYWVWDETTPIVVATQSEFDGAQEMAEILLLTKDSDVSTGGLSWIQKILNWFKK